MVFAVIVFVFSLFGIAALFALKYWELRHEKVLAPDFRRKTDVRARQLKELAYAARADLVKLLPEIVRVARFIVHEAALGFAALARFSERQAHRLADLVSHKRGFERRETRSEFLKKVAEHKNGSSSGLGENGNI
jgi:hypothetical protein